VFVLRVNRGLDPLRTHPRWAEVMAHLEAQGSTVPTDPYR
jgi:hypothetical protein